MSQPQFQIINPNDNKTKELISDWYLSQWNIPKNITSQKVKSFSGEGLPFQVVMTLDDVPATGGLYNRVGLPDKEPGFSIYKYWLALVYTIPNKRRGERNIVAMKKQLCE